MIGTATQTRGFAARRPAFRLASIHAAHEFWARRAANGALRPVDTRLGGASSQAPLSLAFLHQAGPTAPVQHVRNVTQRVQHLHLLQQFIHRLTLRVEQHEASPRSAQPRVPARLMALRERVVETVRSMRDRSIRRNIERLIRDRFARRDFEHLTHGRFVERDIERLTQIRFATQNTERLMRVRFATQNTERLPQLRFAERTTERPMQVRFVRQNPERLPQLRSAQPNIASVTRNRSARRDFERLTRDRFTMLDFERLAHVRLTGRDLQRLLIDRPPTLRAGSALTLHTVIAPLITDTTATVLQRYGAAQPLAPALALRRSAQAQPGEIKREIERIERTVQTKVVREILHQGHQQQQIRTAVSDALLSPKLVQTLARQIHTTLERRANVERYRKGVR